MAAVAAGLSALRKVRASDRKPALLGGAPVRREPFPSWPVFGEPEERGLLGVLRSAKWGRGSGKTVEAFEESYAKLVGARYCLATANGTSALLTALAAAGIEAGDEVVVPPYTFIATINVVLMRHALPVFADTDIETFQIDPKSIEAVMSPRTAAILPVHLGGAACDLDAITSIASRRNCIVIEDACQAHLAEWRGLRVGSIGKAGCFSFQASKNLNSGEGGAMLTNDAQLVERAFAFHNNGRARRTAAPDFTYASYGANLRLTEFQGALLLAQMERLERQARQRDENGRYLTSMLAEIDGIRPARTYAGCTRNAYHLYMFRYDASRFAGLSKAGFLKALRAEGIPASGGYAPLNREPFLEQVIQSKGYRAIYGEARLKQWREQNHCPANDRLCSEAIWLTQNMLLGPRSDMEQIVEAIQRIKAHAPALAKG